MWQQWILGTVTIVGVAALIRAIPKEKINEQVCPWAEKMGALLSKLILSRLPRAAAEKVEEGIICTLLDVAGAVLLAFECGLLADNDSRLKKEGKDGADVKATD